MMRPDAKVEKAYLYPKPVHLRKSVDDLAVLVELDIKIHWSFRDAFLCGGAPYGLNVVDLRAQF